MVMPIFIPNPGAVRSPEMKRTGGKFSSHTIHPQPGEGIQSLCHRLADILRESAAKPLHLFIFGEIRANAAVLDTLRNIFGRVDWPITWIEGAACRSGPIAGIQIQAFAGDVERIVAGGSMVGSVFTDGGARQCFVGGLTSSDKTLSRPEQTLRTLENLQVILAQAGFELAQTVRTWFFLENILSWYDEFNRARTRVYSDIKFRTGSLPASTGVGAKNPAGAALIMAAWAFRPLELDAFAEEVASPLQCSALAYGSSFSRAMEISSNTGRRLFISGTASIAPGGKTLWVGDFRRQMDLTMDVVEAMLHSRGFTFPDLTRATAYFRHLTDVGVFAEWLVANRLTNMPVVSTQCDVCREDLLFELEAEAEL